MTIIQIASIVIKLRFKIFNTIYTPFYLNGITQELFLYKLTAESKFEKNLRFITTN
jgi:hypothetical protein